jgi:hypothetical protein
VLLHPLLIIVDSRCCCESGSSGLLVDVIRQQIPAAPSSRLTTPQSWDDNSSMLELARICPASGELRARPA